MSLLEQLAKLKKERRPHGEAISETERGDRPAIPDAVRTDANPDQPDDGIQPGNLFPDVEEQNPPPGFSMDHDKPGEDPDHMSMAHDRPGADPELLELGSRKGYIDHDGFTSPESEKPDRSAAGKKSWETRRKQKKKRR